MRGFTLIEALVATSIFAVISLIIAQFLGQIFMGNNKAQILSLLKQNGQNALSAIESFTRNADDVICVSANEPKIMVVVSGGIYTRFKIYNENVQNLQNGYITQKTITPTIAEVLQGAVCSSDYQPGNETYLINPSSGISVTNGLFANQASSGYEDVVTISFTLKNALGSGTISSKVAEPLNFQTTIQLLR